MEWQEGTVFVSLDETLFEFKTCLKVTEFS